MASTRLLFWDQGAPPIPVKLLMQILAYKFTEMADLLPDNLRNPTSEIPSFLIEGCSIVPTTNMPSQKKSDVHDILTWVECFNSYIAVITLLRSERARDLLAYMALVIRIAKQFPGQCWYNYDRAFRLQAAASNLINWAQINSDLYITIHQLQHKPADHRHHECTNLVVIRIPRLHANHGMQGLVVVLANFVDLVTNVTGRDVMAYIAASSARNSFANEGVVRETSQAVGDTQTVISIGPRTFCRKTFCRRTV